MVIALDLDGTLLDIKLKYHAVYNHIVTEHGATPLDVDTYWTMKRNKVPNEKILSEGRCFLDRNIYQQRFSELIETPPYLNRDRLTPGADEFLKMISDFAEPVLVTLRKNIGALSEQLKNLHLSGYFKKIVHDTTKDIETAWQRKEHLFKKNFDGKNGIVIGDSEADIRAGRSIGFETVALTCGIRTEKILIQYHPDYILPDLRSVLVHFVEKGVISK